MADDNKKVEEIEEKPKSLVDRFWWVIPPVFLVFIYWPLVLAIPGYEHYIFVDGSSWYVAIVKSIHHEFSVYWFENIRSLFSFKDGGFFGLFMFVFMGIGYIIAIRKNMSLKYKILIPSILGMIGLLVGIPPTFIYGWYILGYDI